jgi:hypothetical protein
MPKSEEPLDPRITDRLDSIKNIPPPDPKKQVVRSTAEIPTTQPATPVRKSNLEQARESGGLGKIFSQ